MGMKKVRGIQVGIDMADALIEMTEIMYNRDTQKRVLTAMRDRLSEFIETIPRSSRGKKK